VCECCWGVLSSTYQYGSNEQVAIVHDTRREGVTRDLRASNHQG
jgi:hypothetical protein